MSQNQSLSSFSIKSTPCQVCILLHFFIGENWWFHSFIKTSMKSIHDQIEKDNEEREFIYLKKKFEKKGQQIEAIAEKLTEFDNLKIYHEEEWETLSKLYTSGLIDENGDIIQKEVMRF